MALGEDKAIMSLVTNSMENTAAHGVGNIRRARTHLRRIIWALLFLFGVSMFTIQATWLISRYFSYEVDINVGVTFQSRAEFPAVTICNMNAIRSSYLLENKDLLELILGDTPSNDAASGGVGTPSWNTGFSTIPRTTETSSHGNSEKYFDLKDVDYFTEIYRGIYRAADAIARKPYDEVRAIGHEMAEMLLACSFNGFPCSPENFTHSYNTQYGNCFTFNGGDSPDNLYTTKVGPLYGLSMELNVEQQEYVHHLQPGAGMRVTVHPRDVMPFPEDNGVTVSPGQETYIGLSKRLVTHLPPPYTDCTPLENISPDSIFLQQFPWIVYNRNTCEKSCLFHEVLRRCNCTDPLYRYNVTDAAVCLYSNSDLRECVENVGLKYVLGELTRGCQCTPACSDTSYETTVSAGIWPNKKYMDDVRDIIDNTEELKKYYDDDPAFVENNFAKVLVYFKELTYEHVHDTERYSFSALLSDIGGQLGLWIGVSVMTVFEFVELMYDIMLVLLRSRKHNHGLSKTGDSQANVGQSSFDSNSAL